MNENAKIYICTHTDFDSPVTNPVYETADARRMFDADVADNGLPGLFYSELMTYHELARHPDMLPPIVGFCGYRKYFSFMDDVPDLADIINEHGCIATTTYKTRGTVEQHYNNRFSFADMDVFKAVVKYEAPWLWPTFKAMLDGHELYACNLFIMRKEDFLILDQLIWHTIDAWLSIVGKDIVRRVTGHKLAYNISGVGIANQVRQGGNLGERLASAYIMHRFPRCKTYDIIFTRKPVIKTIKKMEIKKQDKVVAIVHYNTQELTAAAIRSLEKHTPGTHVIVFDNSDKTPFDPTGIDAEIEILDNTKGQLVNFDEWLEQYPNKRSSGNGHASAKHCKSVQWLFDHRRRHFVVMDSDILIKADISPLWDERYAWVGQESLHRSRYGNLVRVEPALCYINMPMVHEHGVSFLNPAKMYALTGDRKSDAYDTGCWFHEDCKEHGLPTLPVSLDDYAVHMAHGSWKRTAKMVQQFIEDNRALWE